MKPFFYRINAAELLMEVVQMPEAERGSWILQLALDLVSATPTFDFSAAIIGEAKKYKQNKSLAGKKGMESRYLTPNSVITKPNTVITEPNTVITRNRNRKDIEKKTFSENVNLTEAEYQKLVLEHGREFTLKCIDKLSAYKLSSGKKYKSDAGAIRTWVIDEVKKTFRSSSEVLF